MSGASASHEIEYLLMLTTTDFNNCGRVFVDDLPFVIGFINAVCGSDGLPVALNDVSRGMEHVEFLTCKALTLSFTTSAAVSATVGCTRVPTPDMVMWTSHVKRHFDAAGECFLIVGFGEEAM